MFVLDACLAAARRPTPARDVRAARELVSSVRKEGLLFPYNAHYAVVQYAGRSEFLRRGIHRSKYRMLTWLLADLARSASIEGGASVTEGLYLVERLRPLIEAEIESRAA